MSTSASFYALIIGINDYPFSPLRSLSYAVSDAQSILTFLTTTLSVPSQNIFTLLNTAATRTAILTAFRTHLTNNPAIHRGDPILVYYAGHGSRYLTPDGWPTDDGMCEAICPSDRDQPISDLNIDPSLECDTVPDILDMELGTLLRELAEHKGDNLTVIMDCCNSGSGTRGDHDALVAEGYTLRFAPPVQSPTARAAMFANALAMRKASTINDEDGSGLRGAKLHRPDTTTHILLAACRQDQSAAESPKLRAGVFTNALLTSLARLDLPRVTYATLIADLERGWVHALRGKQTPQCEGRHRNRVMFGGRALGVNTRVVPIVALGQDVMRVNAGAVHGVVPGTLFTIHSTQFYLSSSKLGTVVATTVHAVWSEVRVVDLEAPIPVGCFAQVAYWANTEAPFVVAFDHAHVGEQRLHALKQKLERLSMNTSAVGRDDFDVHVRVVDDGAAKTAHVVVSATEDTLVLTRQDPLLLNAGCPARITQAWPPGASAADSGGDAATAYAWSFLCLAARFHFHLHHAHAPPSHPFRPLVSASLVPLVDSSPGSERIAPTVPPISPNPSTSSSPSAPPRWSLPHSPTTQYAIALQNHTPADLWAALYYFDASDYTVTCMYAPYEGMAAPLRAMRSSSSAGTGTGVGADTGDVPANELLVGCGSTGDSAFVFTLHEDEGEKRDVGFVVAVFGERFADLGMWEQEGGFVYREGAEELTSRRGGKNEEEDGKWDTLVTAMEVHL